MTSYFLKDGSCDTCLFRHKDLKAPEYTLTVRVIPGFLRFRVAEKPRRRRVRLVTKRQSGVLGVSPNKRFGAKRYPESLPCQLGKV